MKIFSEDPASNETRYQGYILKPSGPIASDFEVECRNRRYFAFQDKSSGLYLISCLVDGVPEFRDCKCGDTQKLALEFIEGDIRNAIAQEEAAKIAKQVELLCFDNR